MTEQKDILTKLLNGKTSAGALVLLLALTGLNTLGIGGMRSATKEDVQTIINPVVATMYYRVDQSEKMKIEIIANQKLILVELRGLSENNLKTAMILEMLTTTLADIRRSKP